MSENGQFGFEKNLKIYFKVQKILLIYIQIKKFYENFTSVKPSNQEKVIICMSNFYNASVKGTCTNIHAYVNIDSNFCKKKKKFTLI